MHFFKPFKPVVYAPILPWIAGLTVGAFLLYGNPAENSDDLLNQLRLLSFMAGLFLLLGIFTLATFLSTNNRFRKFLFSPYGFLLAALLLPIILLILPDFSLSNITGRSWHPDQLESWMWLYQFYYLGFALLFLVYPRATSINVQIEHIFHILIGVFAGLGLWLVIIFMQTGLRSFLDIDIQSELMPPDQPNWLILLGAIIVGPWSIETLFRKLMITQWEPKIGFDRACLLSAAMYATFQLRPMIWLPAFLMGISLAVLARYRKSLLPSIIAHATFNIMVILLQQNWIF
jgi:membrane protease YdiL (CAAX protease family)